MKGDSSIKNCSSDGTITGSSRVGVILGFSFCSGGLEGRGFKMIGSVENCTSSATVSGDEHDIGGIIGMGQHYETLDCVFTGSVSGPYVGGILGWNGCDVVDGCEFSGKASGTVRAGGITAVSGSDVTNCVVSGNLESGEGYYDENGNIDPIAVVYGKPMVVEWFGNVYIGSAPAILDWHGNKISPENIDIDIDDREVDFDDEDMNFAARMLLGENAAQTTVAGIWSVFDEETGTIKFYEWDMDTKTFSEKVLN